MSAVPTSDHMSPGALDNFGFFTDLSSGRHGHGDDCAVLYAGY